MSVHIWQADKLCTSGLLLARNTTKCLTPSLAICHYQYVHLFKDDKDSKSYFLFLHKSSSSSGDSKTGDKTHCLNCQRLYKQGKFLTYHAYGSSQIFKSTLLFTSLYQYMIYKVGI